MFKYFCKICKGPLHYPYKDNLITKATSNRLQYYLKTRQIRNNKSCVLQNYKTFCVLRNEWPLEIKKTPSKYRRKLQSKMSHNQCSPQDNLRLLESAREIFFKRPVRPTTHFQNIVPFSSGKTGNVTKIRKLSPTCTAAHSCQPL